MCELLWLVLYLLLLLLTAGLLLILTHTHTHASQVWGLSGTVLVNSIADAKSLLKVICQGKEKYAWLFAATSHTKKIPHPLGEPYPDMDLCEYMRTYLMRRHTKVPPPPSLSLSVPLSLSLCPPLSLCPSLFFTHPYPMCAANRTPLS